MIWTPQWRKTKLYNDTQIGIIQHLLKYNSCRVDILPNIVYSSFVSTIKIIYRALCAFISLHHEKRKPHLSSYTLQSSRDDEDMLSHPCIFKMIDIRVHKQTNKQTNKQINKLVSVRCVHSKVFKSCYKTVVVISEQLKLEIYYTLYYHHLIILNG